MIFSVAHFPCRFSPSRSSERDRRIRDLGSLTIFRHRIETGDNAIFRVLLPRPVQKFPRFQDQGFSDDAAAFRRFPEG